MGYTWIVGGAMPNPVVAALAWQAYQRLLCGEPISELTFASPWLAKVTDQQGRTLLHVAAALCRPEGVAALMAAGADPSHQDAWGRFAITSTSPPFILIAAGFGRYKSVNFL